MGFTIEQLRKAADGAMYTSPARICVTADGEVCEETDPRAVRLLVGLGCQIPAAEAARYGLIAMDDVHEALEQAGQALDDRLGRPAAAEAEAPAAGVAGDGDDEATASAEEGGEPPAEEPKPKAKKPR